MRHLQKMLHAALVVGMQFIIQPKINLYLEREYFACVR